MRKIAIKLADTIKENNNLSELDYKKTIFGLECLLGELSKTFIYLTIFFFMGLLLDSVIAMLFFCSLRILAGGYHDDTYWQCLITTFVIFLTIVLIGVNVEITFLYRIILSLISVMLLIVFAPVDHPNKPIISNERRKKFRIASVITGFCYCCFSFLLPEMLGTVAILAIFAESISLPFGILKNRKKISSINI